LPVPIATLLLIIDVALIVHAVKTGRFQPWGYIILVLPGIGALVYIVVELLPEWLGSYKGQVARRTVVRAVNPGRRYRELTDQLAIVDTIANRAALAEECLALGRFEEASFHYAAILAQPLGDEPQFLLGKARAQFGLSQSVAAIATLDELLRRWPNFHSPDGHLLYAIALEAAGRDDEALANYANVGRYFPGTSRACGRRNCCKSSAATRKPRRLRKMSCAGSPARRRMCAGTSANGWRARKGWCGTEFSARKHFRPPPTGLRSWRF
jgi:hypothetical protein